MKNRISRDTFFTHRNIAQIMQRNKNTNNNVLLYILKEVNLRRLERVFCCYSGCETMEDYKEGYLMVWANYMSPCNSIAGLYFEGTCDVISVTMATHKVHKNVH